MCLAIVVSTCCTTGNSSPSEKNVTFRHAAASVRRVIENLSKETGLRLECSAAMEGEIVLVSVTDVPVQQLLDKIASVSAGSWSEKDGVRTLVRSSKALQQDRQKELAPRLALVKQFQSEARAIASKPFDPKAMVAEAEGMGYSTMRYVIRDAQRKTPASRAIGKLFASLDPCKVAALATGERMVFSTSPTRLQLPMPGNAVSALAEFKRDEDAYAAAWNHGAARRKAEDGPEGHNFVRDNFAPRKLKGAVKTAMLVVSQTGSGSWPHWNLELNLYGDRGQRLGECSDEIFRWKNDLERTLAEHHDPKRKDVPADLSPTDLEICRHSHDWLMRGEHAPTSSLSPAALALVSDPDKHDPLSFSASKLLFALADSLGKDLVAQPTEEMFDLAYDLYSLNPAFMTAGKCVAALGLYGMEMTSGDGDWVTLVPDAPASNRKDRANRPALTAAIKELKGGKSSEVDVVAAYLARQPDLTDTRASGAWVDAAIGRHVSEFYWSGGGLFPLRFYTVLKGAHLIPSAGKIGSIPAAGQDVLKKMLYAGADSFEQLTLEARPDAVIPTIAREPTQTLDTGIPSDAGLTVTVTRRPFVYGSGPGRPEYSVYKMARAFHGLETGDRENAEPFNPNDKFIFVVEELIKVKLDLTREVVASFEISKTPPATSKPVPYDQLPQEFRKAVQVKLQDIRKQASEREETIPPHS